MDKAERARLAALSQAEKNTSIQNEVDVIHNAVNSGTADRDTINAALQRIHACLGEPVKKPEPAPLPADAAYRAPGVVDAPPAQPT